MPLAPKELKSIIITNFIEKSASDNLSVFLDNMTVLRNNKTIIKTDDNTDKFNQLTFNYFTKCLFNSMPLEYFNYKLSKFKYNLYTNINNVFNFFNNNFCKFNLVYKSYIWCTE